MDDHEPREIKRIELATLVNEFGAVRVSLDDAGHDARLHIEDLETNAQIWLSPIELAAFTQASPEDRIDWLRVGQYRGNRV